MSIWSALYSDECGVWSYQGINHFGEAAYLPALEVEPLPFKARFECSRKEVLDKEGNRVLSEAYLLTERELRPLDRVRCGGQEWEVKSVSPVKDVTGRLDHYEVAL